jgi:hypothetical protein
VFAIIRYFVGCWPRRTRAWSQVSKIDVIRKELKTSGIQAVRAKQKQNCISHLERMDNTRHPKHALKYKPRGEVVDAPGKDGNTSMPEQFKRPNPWMMMMMMMMMMRRRRRRRRRCTHSNFVLVKGTQPQLRIS